MTITNNFFDISIFKNHSRCFIISSLEVIQVVKFNIIWFYRFIISRNNNRSSIVCFKYGSFIRILTILIFWKITNISCSIYRRHWYFIDTIFCKWYTQSVRIITTIMPIWWVIIICPVCSRICVFTASRLIINVNIHIFRKEVCFHNSNLSFGLIFLRNIVIDIFIVHWTKRIEIIRNFRTGFIDYKSRVWIWSSNISRHIGVANWKIIFPICRKNKCTSMYSSIGCHRRVLLVPLNCLNIIVNPNNYSIWIKISLSYWYYNPLTGVVIIIIGNCSTF